MNRNKPPAWKPLVQGLVPPLLWKAGGALARSLAPPGIRVPYGEEQAASYYDAVYAQDADYGRHYTTSQYYFLWCVLVDRLRRVGSHSVLDIGCGPGQFGSLLRDAGLPRYCGLDLSEEAIQRARVLCPEYEFFSGSVFDSDLPERLNYDTAVSMEFLEHVHEDLAVLGRLRPGSRFFGTVPNFPYESHVRHFGNRDEVRERYGPLFTEFKVDVWLANDQGKQFFLFEGLKT